MIISRKLNGVVTGFAVVQYLADAAVADMFAALVITSIVSGNQSANYLILSWLSLSSHGIVLAMA